jgi:hypothetical protein
VEIADLSGDRFRLEALEDLISLGIDPGPFLRTHTSVVLRPDAVVRRKLEVAIDLIRREGFRPLAVAPVRFSHQVVRSHWTADRPDETGGKEWRRAVDIFIEHTDSMFILLVDERGGELSATRRLTDFKGPFAASQRTSRHLRTALDDGGIPPFNCVHSPNDESLFLRELGLFLNSWHRLRLLGAGVLADGATIEEDLAALTRRLYAERPPHDFSVNNSLDRIADVVRAAVHRRALSSLDGEKLLSLCAASKAGGAAVDELYLRLATSRLEFDPWDLAMVCGKYTKADFQSLQKIERSIT